jgi:glycerate-2-kinase
MLEYPKPGVNMEYIKQESDRLMKAGADIRILNARRMELSAIKKGGLAQAIRPAKVITILISDTPGAPLETVASGPTLPSDKTIIAADRLTLQKAILAADPSLRSLSELLKGEARLMGSLLAQETAGFVATGETTVSVTGHGRGGRNHEVVLGALQRWRQIGRSNGLILSIGTDGIDGSSDAAGAFCDEEVLVRAPDPIHTLLNNDSHHYFQALNAQIKMGPTGSNVADLVISLP